MAKGDLPLSELPIRANSRRGSNNVVHPVEVDSSANTAGAGPPTTTPSPIIPYTQIKHFEKHLSWLVPSFVIANIVMFIITMYVNNCPKNSVSCIADFLGRLSFQPMKENPLLGPSSSTLEKMGALDVNKVVHRHQEFGFVRIGSLYIIAGLGGSLLSALFIQSNISVGASGALFGLLGSMLSELITNWSIYANKFTVLVTLVIIIAINLAVGILPHVDNFAHIGGFLSGFLLGFIFLMRPHFGWVSQRYAPIGYSSTSGRSKFKTYQRILWIISFILIIIWFVAGMIMLLRGVNLNDHCSWCHYMSCVPTSMWSCNNQNISCLSEQMGSQLTLTCSNNNRTGTYDLLNPSMSQIQGLCSQLCR